MTSEDSLPTNSGKLHTLIRFIGDSLLLAWRGRRVLFATALIHRLLAIILLWPGFGLLMRWWLASTGSSVVTDEAIASFLLTPAGLIGAILLAVVGICIFAIEQSSLIVQVLALHRGFQVSVPQAIRFSLDRFRSTLTLVLRGLVIAGLWLAPFFALAAWAGWSLLGPHDINFYLAERPPVFYRAIGIATAILLCGTLIVLPHVASWTVALPTSLFQNLSPAQSLTRSRTLIGNRYWSVAVIWILWFLLHSVLAFLFASALYGMARTIILWTTDWLLVLIPLLGLFFILWNFGNLLLSLFQSVSFAVLVAKMYEDFSPASTKAAGEPVLALLGDPDLFSQHFGPNISPMLSYPGRDNLAPDLPLDRKSRGWLLAATLLCGSALAVGLWLVSGWKGNEHAVVIAHRGSSAYAPDNSLEAFERAIADGADFIELDVQESADGQVIVFHDSDFMKSSGIATKIWEATFDQIRDFDIGSRFHADFKDQRVPLLADVLRQSKDRTPVMIELKSYGRGQRLVERVIEIVEQEQMVEQVVLMSLKYDLVVEAKQLRPDWTVGFLSAVAVGDLTKIECDFLAVNSKLATRSFIYRAHQQNLPVYIWTVDDPKVMLHYLSLGVDGIITNRPDVARQTIDRLRSLNFTERILLDAGIRFGVVPVEIEANDEST
jgi:glycerophosphoryl diester phosphodiesterase